METSKEILSELLDLAPGLANPAYRRIPYAMPAAFFQNFPERLRAWIDAERLQTETNAAYNGNETLERDDIPALLEGLRGKATYRAPEGYFDHIQPAAYAINKRRNNPSVSNETVASRARVIPLPVRMIRYAAAACIVGLLGVAAYQFAYKPHTDPLTTLVTVSDQDMDNFLDSGDFHSITDISLTSETASMDFNENEIHEFLSNVSDAELEAYAPAWPTPTRTVN